MRVCALAILVDIVNLLSVEQVYGNKGGHQNPRHCIQAPPKTHP